MRSLLWLALVLSESPPADLPWQDLSFTIEKDFSTSSDTVTLCRVRVTNHGGRTWPGGRLSFEAVALDGGLVMARERGRFGLSLGPYGNLETIIGFRGPYSRFEVRPVSSNASGREPRGRGSKKRSGKGRKSAR